MNDFADIETVILVASVFKEYQKKKNQNTDFVDGIIASCAILKESHVTRLQIERMVKK